MSAVQDKAGLRLIIMKSATPFRQPQPYATWKVANTHGSKKSKFQLVDAAVETDAAMLKTAYSPRKKRHIQKAVIDSGDKTNRTNSTSRKDAGRTWRIEAGSLCF